MTYRWGHKTHKQGFTLIEAIISMLVVSAVVITSARLRSSIEQYVDDSDLYASCSTVAQNYLEQAVNTAKMNGDIKSGSSTALVSLPVEYKGSAVTVSITTQLDKQDIATQETGKTYQMFIVAVTATIVQNTRVSCTLREVNYYGAS